MSGEGTMPAGLRERFEAARGLVVHDALRVEDGSLADCRALARFHYQPGRPAVVTRVYRIAYRATSAAGRLLGPGDEPAPVGVLVVSMPHAGCVMRDFATGGRYRGLDLSSSMTMLNAEFRTISRVIVHPQFRGLGLAVRLVRHALANAETIFTESLAAMGRAHPFLQKAGMTRYDRPIRPEHARLIDALERLGIEPSMLAKRGAVERRIERLETGERAWIMRELRRWHRKACMRRSHARQHTSLDAIVRDARARLMLRPVYHLWRRETNERKGP